MEFTRDVGAVSQLSMLRLFSAAVEKNLRPEKQYMYVLKRLMLQFSLVNHTSSHISYNVVQFSETSVANNNCYFHLTSNILSLILES